jgi:hypothetical protein
MTAPPRPLLPSTTDGSMAAATSSLSHQPNLVRRRLLPPRDLTKEAGPVEIILPGLCDLDIRPFEEKTKPICLDSAKNDLF